MHEVPTTGAWQRGRLRLPVKQSPTRTRWFESIRTHQLCRASSTGRAAASKAEGSRFDSVVRCQTSRRSQVVEGGGLQSRRREPASVRSGRHAGQDVAQQRAEGRAQRAIGPSSSGLVSSADQSSRLLPGGSAVRIGHEAPLHFPDSADGRAPGCYPGGPWFEATSGSQFSVISRSSVAEHRLDKAGVGGSFPPAGTSFISVWRRWQRA